MREYLQSIAASIVRSTDKEIEVVPEAQELELHLDTAVPCGMIVNELASLSLFHSLGESSSGTVRIGMKKVEEEFLITLKADGTDPFGALCQRRISRT
jgi:two-component sensor histidine kinase